MNENGEKNLEDEISYQLLQVAESQLNFVDKIDEKLQDLHQNDLQVMNKLERVIAVGDNTIKQFSAFQQQSTTNSNNLTNQIQDIKTQTSNLLNQNSQSSYFQNQTIQNLRNELQEQTQEIKNLRVKLEKSDESFQELRNELYYLKKETQKMDNELADRKSKNFDMHQKIEKNEQNIQQFSNEIQELKQAVNFFQEQQRLIDQKKISKYNLDELYEVKFRQVHNDGENVIVKFDVESQDFSNLTIKLPIDYFGKALLAFKKKINWDFDQNASMRFTATRNVLSILHYKIVKAIMTEQDLDKNKIELELQSSEGQFFIYRAKSAYILTLALWYDNTPIYITKSAAQKLCKK